MSTETEPWTREQAIDRLQGRDLWKAVAAELLEWEVAEFRSVKVPDDVHWIEDDYFQPHRDLRDALRVAELVGEWHSLGIRFETESLGRYLVCVLDRDGTVLRTFRSGWHEEREPHELVLMAVLFVARLTEGGRE